MSVRRVSIADIAEIVTKGTTPTTLGRRFTESGVNFIKAEALNGDSGLDTSGLSFIDEETHELLRRSILEEDDVLVTIAGARVGRCGYVKAEHLPANTNQAVGIVRVRRDKAVPRFVYYFFKHPSTFALCQGLGSQSAQPNVNLTILKSIQMRLPSMETQEKTASILSAYDDLIENNRRRIQLLEQTVRLLYKEWFVRLRFPGHEHVKIKDGVPERWEKVGLSSVAEITMGQSPESKHYNEDGVGLPFHQGVTDFGSRFPENRTYCTLESRIAEPGDILFSVRAPVGRINITLDKIVIGRGLAAIRSIRDQQNFLYYQLKSHFFKEDMIGAGAIFAAITKKDLHSVEILQPSSHTAELFLEHVAPIDRQIEILHKACGRLDAGRDLLLPRLMNGEIAA